ncbi:hypothetical protein FSHL1_006184 [Fusarium sambucinum]
MVIRLVIKCGAGNIRIVSGGSAMLPPGTVLDIGASTKVSKSKKKKKAKKAKKDDAALAKAVGDLEMTH